MSRPDAILPDHERRKFPRYYVSTRLTLAIEDESLKESLGLGEPSDISLGGLRVCNLPACPNVRVGDPPRTIAGGPAGRFDFARRGGPSRYARHLWR